MYIRQTKNWDNVTIKNNIRRLGRAAPLSMQFDIDMNINGENYILKVQPHSQRRFIALQALREIPDSTTPSRKTYELVTGEEGEGGMLNALMDIFVYQTLIYDSPLSALDEDRAGPEMLDQEEPLEP